MTEETPQDPYAGQPYYGQYPQQYPQQNQQPYQHPYQQPYGQYPQQYQPYPPYPPPPPGYPYGAYPYPGAGRPGTATAAAVLAFVAGGLLIVAALFLFTGASLISDFGDSLNANTDPTTTELSVDGVVNMIAAALLIAGGVSFVGRKAAGRSMLTLGGLIVVACSIYWMTRFDTFGATVFYGLLFAALAVLCISMAYTTTARAWLASGTSKPA